MESEWISVRESLPEDTGKPYRVVSISVRKYDLLPGGREGNYHGQGKMAVRQDWVIRNWPQNFTYWTPLKEPPEDV